MNNTVYTSKEKNYEFSSKKLSATKHSPPSNIYYMAFYSNFLFEYSLIGIVKPKFTKRNEMMQNLGNRSVQKCAQKAGSYVLNTKEKNSILMNNNNQENAIDILYRRSSGSIDLI